MSSMFQGRVGGWMRECFGPKISEDHVERADRFVEEALELAQATGWTRDRGHALVDYVFDRPVGEPGQEVGGVRVTLAALCNTHGIDEDREALREIDRISTPEMIEKIRAKQAAKPTGSALPIAMHRREPLTKPENMPEDLWEIAYDHTDQLWDLFGCDEVKRDRVTTTISGAIVEALTDKTLGGAAMVDIMAERDRQMMVEGWTEAHDDQHTEFELSQAAAAYANHAGRPDYLRLANEKRRAPPELWPWGERWFKPKDRRRDLVRAAALLVAEIERLDRAASKQAAS